MIYKSDDIKDLALALDAAQNEFDPVLRDSKNPLYNSKYADLDGVLTVTQPTLSKHHLVISQPPISDLEVKGVGVSTILIHTLSGQYIGSDLLLPAVGYGKDKSERYDSQTGCGAITYARRNAYLAILGISATDDDGNSSSGQRAAEPVKPVARPNNPPQKAQIPNGDEKAKAQSGNNEPLNGSGLPTNSGSLPTAEELEAYRQRFGKMVDALSTAGLKSSKGLPLQKKVLAYLLYVTGQTEASNITTGQWNTFFEAAGNVTTSEGGIKQLVELVNSAVGGKS